MENPDPSVLQAYGRGAHAFLALGESLPLLASNRDPTMYEYGARPGSNREVHVCIHSGGCLVRRGGGGDSRQRGTCVEAGRGGCAGRVQCDGGHSHHC